MSFEDLVSRDVLHFQETIGLQPGADRQVILLKGHLLIEEQLQAFIESKLRHPEAISDARFAFHQRLALAKALYSEPNRFGYGWVWESIKLLNSLRNLMVHNVSPKGFTQQLTKFVSGVEKHLPKRVRILPGEGADYEMARLGLSISLLNVGLTRLIHAESLGNTEPLV